LLSSRLFGSCRRLPPALNRHQDPSAGIAVLSRQKPIDESNRRLARLAPHRQYATKLTPTVQSVMKNIEEL
jgi:hypothetical protein